MNKIFFIILYSVFTVLISIYVGESVGDSDVQKLVLQLAVLVCLAWIILANQNWWIVVPCSTALLGVFNIPFKIYPHEVAIVLALVALAPLIIVKKQKAELKPFFVIYFLLLLLLVRCAFCIYAVLDEGDFYHAAGNIFRSYVWGIWPLVFMVAFALYGKLSSLKNAFILIVLVSIIQITGGVISAIFHQDIVIPGLNYTFSVDAGEGDQDTAFFALRSISILLLVLSFYMLSVWKGWKKSWGFVLLICSLVIMLLSGGRSASAAGIFYLIVWLFYYSHRILLIILLSAVILLAFIVNVNPSLLYSLPFGATRALTTLVIDQGFKEEMFGGGAGSDDWHHNLMDIGYKRWTTDAKTFVFGYGTTSTSEMDRTLESSEAWYRFALSAADTGSYENTFWTILNDVGLLGFLFYLLLYIRFIRLFFRYLTDHHQLTTLYDFTIWWAFAALVVSVVTCTIAGGLPGMPLVLAAIAEKIILEVKTRDLQSA